MGAGPIVTNAVVAVQSYLKATGQGVYTAAQMTELLRRTGTPQTGTRLVGPLPDVAAALRSVEVDAPSTRAAFSSEGVNGWYLNPTITLSASDGWGVGVVRHGVPVGRRRLDGRTRLRSRSFRPVPTRSSCARSTGRGTSRAATSCRSASSTSRLTVGGSAGAAVPATLSLTLGPAAAFGAFVPGIDREYTATTTASVVSTAGDATLSVADPSSAARGRLVNGTFALDDPLRAMATSTGGTGSGTFAPLGDSGLALLSYAGPVSNDAVAIAFRQRITAGQALRTGSYAKTLTFTLSTTTP